MDSLVQDLRYALRQLRKRPGFAAAVALTLALGIGANTAVFSVVDAVVLRPLPYPRPDGLQRLWSAYPERGESRGSVSPHDLADWREQSDLFEHMAGYPTVDLSGLVLAGEGEPRELATAYVTEDFFETLGVAARRGRVLRPDDHVEGRNRVVVLGHGLWQRRFGGDPGLVGGTVSLSGEPFTVVGIMPPGFEFPEARTEAWAPVSLIPDEGVPRRRFIRWLSVVGRLREGADPEAAREEMTAIARCLNAAYPEANEDLTAVAVRPLREELVGPVRPALLTVFGAVALVLLIACANVASLALARSEDRARELGVRGALGAGRGRLARQLLAESVVLALLGGAAGSVLGVWGVRALVALAPADIPRLASVGVDLRLLGFAAAVSVLTGLLFGLAPAVRASRPDLQRLLREAGRGTGSGRGGGRLRNLLVVGQVAMVALLAVGAGLLVRSYGRLLAVEPGFRAEDVLTLRVSAGGDDYREFLERALDRIRDVPGVRAAGFVRPLPLGGEGFQGESWRFEVVGPAAAEGRELDAPVRFASPGYFRAMGIPRLAGREFDERDDGDAPPVLIASRSAAERYWGSAREAVGRRLRIGDGEGEVIGVVGDVRQLSLSEEPVPALYVAHRQIPRRGVTFAVRGEDPGALVGPVRRAIWDLRPEQPIEQIASLERLVSSSLSRPRFSMTLLGTFAALAVVLAAVGIYGVLSYTVSRRVPEIGLRMALGARRVDVLRMVAARGLLLAAAGVAVGLAAAALATSLMEGLLFGVGRLDPWAFAGGATLLLLVAAAASVGPALRATRTDPLLALRRD